MTNIPDDSARSLDAASPRQLASLLAIGGEPAPAWAGGTTKESLESILHGGEDQALAAMLRGRTLLETLLARDTPSDLLLQIKDHAKLHQSNVAHALHGETGVVIYFCAIAAAWVHQRKEISSRSLAEQREGFLWAAEKVVNGPLVEILKKAACA